MIDLRGESVKHQSRELTGGPKSQSRSVSAAHGASEGSRSGGRAWFRSREVFRDAVCARLALRVMGLSSESRLKEGARTALRTYGLGLARSHASASSY